MVAYGFFTAVLLLVMAALVWILFLPIVNGYTDQVNRLAVAGEISEQTVQAFGLMQMVYNLAFPVITLFVAMYYAVIRALEQKRAG